MPKASDLVGHSRYSSTDDPYYKGEKNLRNMDSPAISRRGLNKAKSLNKQNDEAPKEDKSDETNQKKGDKLLNDRREQIDKSDTNQPAFLRKIMD